MLLRQLKDQSQDVVTLSRPRISILTTVGVTYEIQNKHTQFLSLIKKLSIDNYYTSKSSAAALICRLFGSFPEKPKKEAFRILEDLMSKEIPSVTKTISQHLKSLLESNWDDFRDQVFSMVEQLCQSPHECIKVASVGCLQAIASSVNKKAIQQSNVRTDLDQRLPPLLVSLMNDPSWRVRLSICSNIKSVRHTPDPVVRLFQERRSLKHYRLRVQEVAIRSY